jgi:DNA-binding NarL/FixJ family response regulator
MAWKKRPAARRTVCILSSHPLVLRELEQVLTSDRFRLQVRRIAASPLKEPDWSSRASLYVVDAQLPQPTTETLIGAIARRFPKSRILIVSDRFREAEAFGLLRLGVKGLVPYSELREKLSLAIDTVAAGGFWVPRALLSRFLDTIVGSSRGRPQSGLSASISGREREVLETLLDNLSNKQIADRLHISERTVKFHVSNLLAKFQLARRQDLILHCLGLAARDRASVKSRRLTPEP